MPLWLLLIATSVTLARYDYNQIGKLFQLESHSLAHLLDFEERVGLIGNRTEIICPLLPMDRWREESSAGARHTQLDEIVSVIFWYKGLNTLAPFVTIDARAFMLAEPLPAAHHIWWPQYESLASIDLKSNRVADRGRHRSVEANNQTGTVLTFFVHRTELTESFFNRTSVNVDLYRRTATLIIDQLQMSDEGIYRCRVDFRWSRTFLKFFQFQIIGTTSLTFDPRLTLIVVPPNRLFIYDQDHKWATNGVAGPYQEGQANVRLTCETKEGR